MKSKAIVFEKVFNATINDLDIPSPSNKEIITKTIYSGVSTGTETRVYSGKQEGGIFPLIPGYENIGEIVECGTDVKLKPGQMVFSIGSSFTKPFTRCWGGHVEYSLLNEDSVIPVAKDINLLDALYAKVGGIALHGVKRAKISEKDTVAIVGLGLIGHLAVQCVKAQGARVIAIDKNKERLECAKKAGADYVIDPEEKNLMDQVKEISNGGVSVAMDVTGVASTVNLTAQLVYGKPWAPPYPPSARVVILGSYTEPISFSYIDALFMNEPDILPSRDTTAEDLSETLSLIEKKQIKPDIIPAKIFSYLDVSTAYKEMYEKKLMRITFSWE